MEEHRAGLMTAKSIRYSTEHVEVDMEAFSALINNLGVLLGRKSPHQQRI
jgi:hypothetical protein